MWCNSTDNVIMLKSRQRNVFMSTILLGYRRIHTPTKRRQSDGTILIVVEKSYLHSWTLQVVRQKKGLKYDKMSYMIIRKQTLLVYLIRINVIEGYACGLA